MLEQLSSMEYKVVWHIDEMECNCRKWLDHWMRATKSKVIPKCSVAYCTRRARTGGHVVACDDPHGQVFVIPLCSEHDSTLFKECFETNRKTKLIEISMLKTCQ